MTLHSPLAKISAAAWISSYRISLRYATISVEIFTTAISVSLIDIKYSYILNKILTLLFKNFSTSSIFNKILAFDVLILD